MGLPGGWKSERLLRPILYSLRRRTDRTDAAGSMRQPKQQTEGLSLSPRPPP